MRTPFLAAVTLAVMTAPLAGCSDPCSSELLDTRSASNGKQARLIRRGCGATSGFSYDVRLAVSGDPPETGTVLLRFDSNHATDWPEDVASIVHMVWKDDRSLDVAITRPIRVFKLRDHGGGVGVHYTLVRGSEL